MSLYSASSSLFSKFQSNDDDFDWERHTPGEGGSVGDHTTGSGYYASFDAGAVWAGDRGVIHTGPLAPNSDAGGGCFSFWYFIEPSKEVREARSFWLLLMSLLLLFVCSL